MAYKTFDESVNQATSPQNEQISLKIDGPEVTVPDASFIKNASLTRDGMDLTLEGTDSTIIIEGYYSAETAPNIVSADGATLTPALVNSFTTSTPRFASTNSSISDVSPVGAVNEVSGKATVTHPDGTTEIITNGTKIFEGDIVETETGGALNIIFQDETSFAVSDNARLAIDEYVYDPATDAGTTNFSVLKGVFVFTSGLIGREDPDDVHIETPLGSIGIRGTIIAGDVDNGEITVVEGAIVLQDFNGNEITLANQFETAKFGTNGGAMEHMGELAANDVAGRFSGVSGVAPDLFSSINDAAGEAGKEAKPEGEEAAAQAEDHEAGTEETAEEQGQDPEGEQAAPQDQEAQPENAKEGDTGEGEQAPDEAAAHEGEQGEQQRAEEAGAGANEEGQGPEGQEGHEGIEGREEGRQEAQGDQQQGEGEPQQAQGQEGGPDGEPNAQGQPQNQPHGPAEGSHNFGEHAGQNIGGDALNFSLGLHDGAAPPPPGTGPHGNFGPHNPDAAGDPPPPPPPPPTDGDGTGDDSTGSGGNAGTAGTQITHTAINEGTTGTFATITGVNGTITSLTIDGIAANFITATSTATGVWELSIDDSNGFDFEDAAGANITYTAIIQQPDGTNTSILGHVDPTASVLDVNEPIEHHYSETTEGLVTHEGASFTYDLGKDFHDPEGNLTFSIDNIIAKIDANGDGDFIDTSNTEIALGIDIDDSGGLLSGSHSETNTISDLSQLMGYLDFTQGTGEDGAGSNTGWDFNTSTGELTLYFDDTFTTSHDLLLDLQVTATDGTHSRTENYLIDSMELDYDHSGDASGLTAAPTNMDDTAKALTNYDDNFTLDSASGGNYIFANNGADDINIYGGSVGGNFVDAGAGNDTIFIGISSNASGNIVKGGAGDDTFTVADHAGTGSTGENILLGGTGNDTFNIQEGVSNKYHGGEDNDLFNFDLGNYGSVLTDLQGGGGQFFSGGTGFDTIKISGDNATLSNRNLDFTNIDDSIFKGIEKIDLSDAANYTVTLNAQDVFEMTDNENVLKIDGDSGDTVNLTNDGGHSFALESSDATYNTYSNGDVTLIIDADIAVTGALAGI